MIGLDTNVLVRYITQDDPAQSGKATRLIENDLTSKEPGFLTLIALIEITWVLESCYPIFATPPLKTFRTRTNHQEFNC